MRNRRHDRRVVSSMMLGLTLFGALAVSPSSAGSDGGVVERAPRHVVLVTLDGARWQDIRGERGALFPDEHPLMPSLWHHVLTDGVWLDATTSSAPRSLPSYQALLTGHVTSCDSNDCARVV